MPPTRLRITVRWLMVAVFIAALTLVIEITLHDLSKAVVSDRDDGKDYIRGEAWSVWAILQIPILLTLVMVIPLKTFYERHDYGLRADEV